jgi:hypothetical protein
MWRRVPCEQQLNMGQPVLRDAEKSVAKVLDVYLILKGAEVYLEGESG